VLHTTQKKAFTIRQARPDPFWSLLFCLFSSCAGSTPTSHQQQPPPRDLESVTISDHCSSLIDALNRATETRDVVLLKETLTAETLDLLLWPIFQEEDYSPEYKDDAASELLRRQQSQGLSYSLAYTDPQSGTVNIDVSIENEHVKTYHAMPIEEDGMTKLDFTGDLEKELELYNGLSDFQEDVANKYVGYNPLEKYGLGTESDTKPQDETSTSNGGPTPGTQQELQSCSSGQRTACLNLCHDGEKVGCNVLGKLSGLVAVQAINIIWTEHPWQAEDVIPQIDYYVVALATANIRIRFTANCSQGDTASATDIISASKGVSSKGFILFDEFAGGWPGKCDITVHVAREGSSDWSLVYMMCSSQQSAPEIVGACD